MENKLAVTGGMDASTLETVLVGGDLGKLSPDQRLSYYRAICDSLGLNPLTKPFDYIPLNGRLVLYAKKDAADQLRKNNGVSIVKLERDRIDQVYTVTAYATDKTGRQDSSIGAVNIENLRGDALANAIMKAETKAKRRVTLSICGLGMLDETEIQTIPDAKPGGVNLETGEIVDATVVTTAVTMAEPDWREKFIDLYKSLGIQHDDAISTYNRAGKDYKVAFEALAREHQKAA